MVYAIFLLIVSLRPGQAIPGIFDWGELFSPDKLAHFTAYAIFAVLLSFAGRRATAVRRAAVGVPFSAAFGALIEVLQGVAGTGRFFDPVDMVANLLGAVLGGAIYLLLHYLVFKRLAPART